MQGRARRILDLTAMLPPCNHGQSDISLDLVPPSANVDVAAIDPARPVELLWSAHDNLHNPP
jgi:hypothetical protein